MGSRWEGDGTTLPLPLDSHPPPAPEGRGGLLTDATVPRRRPPAGCGLQPVGRPGPHRCATQGTRQMDSDSSETCFHPSILFYHDFFSLIDSVKVYRFCMYRTKPDSGEDFSFGVTSFPLPSDFEDFRVSPPVTFVLDAVGSAGRYTLGAPGPVSNVSTSPLQPALWPSL